MSEDLDWHSGNTSEPEKEDRKTVNGYYWTRLSSNMDLAASI